MLMLFCSVSLSFVWYIQKQCSDARYVKIFSLARMRSCCAVFPRGFSCGWSQQKQSHSPLLPTGSLISLFIRQYSQCKLTQPLSTWPPHVNSMGETAGIKDWVMDDVSKRLCWAQMNPLAHIHVHNDDRQALMHGRLQRSATLDIH